MLDHNEKIFDSEDTNMKLTGGDMMEQSKSSSSSSNGDKKTCNDCGTSKTPLWRGGPAGPKSLCNACGIRNRKKRRSVITIGSGSGTEDKKSKKSDLKRNTKLGDSLKQRIMELGRDVMMQRSTVEKQRRKLGEEEQAAVLLMALSCGSVYA